MMDELVNVGLLKNNDRVANIGKAVM